MGAHDPIVKNTAKTEKAVEVIKSGFGWFGVILIALAYLGFSFLVVKEKEASLLEIILRTATSFLVGFSINRMLDIQGINAGLSTPDFISVDKQHFEATQQLGKDKSRLRKYTSYLNKESLKDARTTILSYEGLDYDEYFDKKGKFIGSFGKVTKGMDKDKVIEINSRNKNIRKAISHKVTQLSPQSLLSDDVKVLDPNYQGETIGQYTTKSVSLDIAAKLLPAFIVGRIGVAFVETASGAAFLFASLELSLYTLMGFIKYYTAFSFITKKYKQRIINKTLQLLGVKDWQEEPEEVKINGNKTGRDVSEPALPSRAVETNPDATSTNELQSGTAGVISTTTSW
jgi:hypothetical protein